MPEKKFGSTPEEGKLFIGGLTYRTSDDMLKDFYSQWGRLVDFIVMKDSDTKRSRGFGFVTYESAQSAELAMSNLPHILDGKQVDPKWAMPRESDPSQQGRVAAAKEDKGPPVKRIFLSGIKDEHTEPMFMEYFSQFGNILALEIVTDKVTGRKRGFGYITYDSIDAVEKCIVSKSHMIGGLRCDVKKALTKDEMGAKTGGGQYGRDRMERDSRSRGTGRGDGYGFQGGYGDYNPANGWNRPGAYPANQNWGQSPMNYSTAGSTGGPMTATYYPPTYGGGGGQSAAYGQPSGAYQPPPTGSYGSPAYGQPGHMTSGQQGGSAYNPPPMQGGYSYGQYGGQSGSSQGSTGGWTGQQSSAYPARR